MTKKCCLIVCFGLSSLSLIPQPLPVKAETVLLLVNDTDPDLYSAISGPLTTYIHQVEERFGVSFQVVPDDYYHAYTAPQIRTLLHNLYDSIPDLTGAILVGTIPYATYRHGDGSINPAPLFYEDFEADWIDAHPLDGHYELIVTDPYNNPTEIWTAWWIPPTNSVYTQASFLTAYLLKLASYYEGTIEGENSLLFIGSNMTNLGYNTDWVKLLLNHGEQAPPAIDHIGVYSSDQSLMWGYHGVESWLYPQDLTKSRYWSGLTWIGFTAAYDFTPYQYPSHGASDVEVDELVYLWNEQTYKYCHTWSHGSPGGIFYEGAGNYFQWSDVGLIQAGQGANVITTSGCSNGNFRGSTGTTCYYERSLGNQLVFSTNTACVTFYGSASSQSTALFAEYHELLVEGLHPDPSNYFAKGYYAMRNSDIVWGDSHYFFRSVDDKVLLGNPFVTWLDSTIPTATATFTATMVPSPTPTPTTTPTLNPDRLYLNALYLAEHKVVAPGAQRYYQDTVIRNQIPTTDWDGGCMDVGVIHGYYDLGTGFSLQGAQINPTDILDLGVGLPSMVWRGAINNLPVAELDPLIPLLNRPQAPQAPVEVGSHAEYIAATRMTKVNLNHELAIGKNQFTLLLPEASEVSTTGLIAAFVSNDPNGLYFGQGAAPTIASLDSATSQGGALDAGGEWAPTHPGMLDVGYFQPCTYQLSSDSRTAKVGRYTVRISYFNVAGDVTSSLGYPYGITGHGAPGWFVGGAIGYNSIDGSTGDCIAYLEIEVIPPPPVPTTGIWSIIVLLALGTYGLRILTHQGGRLASAFSANPRIREPQ